MTIERDGRWLVAGGGAQPRPRPGPARLRRRLPRAARAGGRGRQRPGPARVPRPALRRLRRRVLGALPRQARLQAAAGRHRDPPGRLLRGGRGRLAGAGRLLRRAGLGEARPARLQRRDRARLRDGRAGARGRGRPPARSQGDRRGAGARQGGRVLAARQRGPASLVGRERSSPGRPIGTTTRRNTPRAGWSYGSPPRSPIPQRERLRDLARSVFTLCGCSGLARCDFFVDGETVLVNELNTIPGFTETSVYGKLWEAEGIPYSELCDRLVQLALERYETSPLVRVLEIRSGALPRDKRIAPPLRLRSALASRPAIARASPPLLSSAASRR